MGIELEALVDEGLRNSCYLLDLGDGRALVVDPPRDLRAVRARAGRLGLRVIYAADTHLHADFLSGALQLAADEGATVLASAAGRRGFPHRGLGDGDEVDLGGLRLRALSTPGHTDEHLSFLLADGGTPLGVFTGGSLIVGSAARTDLLGEDRTEGLARAQYASLRRLAALPEDTVVWPTHGAGSFCSAPRGRSAPAPSAGRWPPTRCWASRTRTGSSASCSARCAATRRTSCGSGRSTATARPSSTPPAPVGWRRCRRRRSGGCATAARSWSTRGPSPTTPAGACPTRCRSRCAPSSRRGWLARPRRYDAGRGPQRRPGRRGDRPAGVAKIGYDRLAGELAGGMDAWTAAGQPTASTELVTPDQIGDRHVLDVRQRTEFTAGHLPGARHIELGAITAAADRLPTAPTVVMCGHGERAGYRDLAVLIGGPDDWAQVIDRDLETGS